MSKTPPASATSVCHGTPPESSKTVQGALALERKHINSLQLLADGASTALHTVVQCCDLAILADGSLIFAAMRDGIIEYSSDGKLLRVWPPPPTASGLNDGILSVAALPGDRVAAGLFHSSRVAVLNRCYGGWSVERVWRQKLRPQRMAACSDLFAVTGRSLKTGEDCVRLISLADGKVLANWKLVYKSEALALTKNIVMVASSDAVNPVDHNQTGYIVDAYTYSGELLRRIINAQPITSLAADLAGLIVYLAIPSRRSVIATKERETNFYSLMENLGAGLSLRPTRIALLEKGESRSIAVLFGDWQTVAVFIAPLSSSLISV